MDKKKPAKSATPLKENLAAKKVEPLSPAKHPKTITGDKKSPSAAAKGAAAKSPKASPTKTAPAATPKPPHPYALPKASVERAKKAFKNFKLSKFGNNPPPANHAGTATRTPEFRKKTAKVMNDIIARSFIDRGASSTTPPLTPNPNNLGMSVSLPVVEKLLPSYVNRADGAGTVDLDEFVNLLEKKRSGSEFYAKGNLTLNRISVQNKVQAIINQITNPIKK